MDGERRSGDGTEPGAEPSDEALMRALARGSDEALRELYARHAPLVYAVALRSLDRPAAEEIVQDVLFALWRSAERFDPERGSLRTWLLSIAHRRVLNELRRRRRRPRLEADPDGEAQAALPDPGPSPAALTWLGFRRAAVQSALDRLPPAQRQALALAFFEDLTHEQVAELLELRLGTAKTRIRAALRKLRASLAPLLAVLALALGGAVLKLGSRAALEDRALELVTSSDVTPLRLEAAPGAPRETHATWRGRAGSELGVLTLSHFAEPPAGKAYQAWLRHGEVWTSLGTARPDATGHARLIAEDPACAAPPDALQVTLEPAAGSAAPSGPVVVRWPASDPVADPAHE